MGICFPGSGQSEIYSSSEYDWASDIRDRKSINAFLFVMPGGAASSVPHEWSAVATSTC